MQCPKCKSSFFKLDGRINRVKQRYKCNECGKRFCETTNTFFHRNRIPKSMLVIAIFFHLFVPSRIVKIFMLFIFRCKISRETVCLWSRKFLEEVPEIRVALEKSNNLIIRHTDEKHIKIKGKKAYWWNTVNHEGKLFISSISLKPDLKSAKTHISKCREIENMVDIHVTDGLPAYSKATNLLGRRCRHIKAGLQEKMIMHKRKLLFLSNLPVERINSKIDFYINLKVRGSFENLESANRWRKAFMFTEYLHEVAALQNSFGTYLNQTTNLGELLFQPQRVL